jgi:hypothetical protein
VSVTLLPLCRPTPVAVTTVLRVRCFNMAGILIQVTEF